MSVMVGSVTESLAPDENFLQGVNATVDEVARDHFRVQLASTLSVLVGLFQVQSRRGDVTPPPPPPTFPCQFPSGSAHPCPPPPPGCSLIPPPPRPGLCCSQPDDPDPCLP